MSADDIDAVAVGDTVYVFDGFRRSEFSPTPTGVVVKIGRTLVHVEERGGVTTYRRETHCRSDGYAGGFKTSARRLDDARRSSALAGLRFDGVEIDRGGAREWATGRLVKVAAVVQRLKTAPMKCRNCEGENTSMGERLGVFHVGCDDCSETLKILTPDEVLDLLELTRP